MSVDDVTITSPSPRMSRLLADLTPRALEEFWSEVTVDGTPLIEPLDDGQDLVTFLWRGYAYRTRAWWGVDVPMRRVPGTDLWHGSQAYPRDMSTVYCLQHDAWGDGDAPRTTDAIGDSHVDEFNRVTLKFPGDPGDNEDYDTWMSVLRLSEAPPETWSARRPEVIPGTLFQTSLLSEPLGGPRHVSVYLPLGYDPKGLPIMVVFDGFQARHVLNVHSVLDNLIANGKIPPMNAVFVDSHVGEREEMLTPGPAIVHFVTRELLPWARETFRAGTESGNIIAGVSRGGLIAAYVGLQAPGVFDRVIAQSGSFWWPSPDEGEPGRLIREVASRPRSEPLRFYLDVGTREDMPGPGGAPSQLLVNRAMRDALQSKGYPVRYAEYNGAHDYINWRRTFSDALLALTAGE